MVFQPVKDGGERLGTLYLKSGHHPLYVRLRFYGGIVLLVLLGSMRWRWLSPTPSAADHRPILALADMAKVVSERGDYSVRANKISEDEKVC